MSRLVLVRHGQASYGAPDGDYDRLSPLGELQSQLAGERLARELPRVGRVCCGPRRRHRQTAERLVAAARAGGGDYPDAIVEEDLDELPARELVLAHGLGPDLLVSVMQAVRRWAAGELAPPGVITAVEFTARIESVLARLFPVEGAAVVVTSGGPIAVPLLRSGAIGDIGEAFTRGLELANASVSFLAREDGRLRLQPGDPVAHLLPEQRTNV
jgi:broad specificity phosphatase PhoE